MGKDNVIDLSARFQSMLELLVEEVESPCDEVFVDDERVIIRTPAGTGMAMTPLGAKELAVRLIEAAVLVERG